MSRGLRWAWSWRVTAWPRSMVLTSLLVTAGTPSASSMTATTSKPSQPGMIGGAVGRPDSWSMGPGRDAPAAHTGRSRGPAMSRSRAAASARVGAGPRVIDHGRVRHSTGAPPRSVTASRRVEEWTPATRTRPSSCRKRQVAGARPPVDGPDPFGAISPRATAVLSREEMVLRPMPVIWASCWRVLARPRRTRSTTVRTSVSI